MPGCDAGFGEQGLDSDEVDERFRANCGGGIQRRTSMFIRKFYIGARHFRDE